MTKELQEKLNHIIVNNPIVHRLYQQTKTNGGPVLWETFLVQCIVALDEFSTNLMNAKVDEEFNKPHMHHRGYIPEK